MITLSHNNECTHRILYMQQEALYEAIRKGDIKRVQRLCVDPSVRSAARPAADNNHAIFLAAAYGHLHVAQFLCGLPGVDPSAEDNVAMRWASENGFLEVVKFLCSRPGVKPFVLDNEAIRHAAKNGHLDVVRFLYQLPGVNPTARDNYAVRHSAENGHLAVVQSLCELPGVDPTADDYYAVRWAAIKGHGDVVHYLCALLTPAGLDDLLTSQNTVGKAKVQKEAESARRWYSSVQCAWLCAHAGVGRQAISCVIPGENVAKNM